MSIADKITSIETHIGDIYDTLEVGGADLTNVNKNIVNINSQLKDRYLDYMNNGTQEIWDNWEKVTGEGTSLTLNNTEKAPIKMDLKGNTTQYSLPSEYTAVEYIESNGTEAVNGSYINTGYYPNTNTSIEMVYKFISASGSSIPIIGERYTDINSKFVIWTNNNDKTAINFGTYDSGFIADTNPKVKNTISNVNANLYYNGTAVTSTTDRTFTSTASMFIFGLNSGSACDSRNQVVQLYSLKIYDNGDLVRYFVPCYRNNDNEIGLFDIVNDVFYTNQGNGAFTKGNNISLPTPDIPVPVNVVNGDNEINIESENLLDEKGLLNATFITGTYKYTKANFKGDRALYVRSKLKEGKSAISGLYVAISNVGSNPNSGIAKFAIYNGSVSSGNTRQDYSGYEDLYVAIYPTTYTWQDVLNNYDVWVCIQSDTTYSEYQGQQTYPINLPEGMELCNIPNTDYEDNFIHDKTLDKWYWHREAGKIATYNGETITTDYISTTGQLTTGATIYYGLSTPTDTEITYQPLIEQLNNLEKAMSYNGQTNISQVNNDLPFIIRPSALKEWSV